MYSQSLYTESKYFSKEKKDLATNCIVQYFIRIYSFPISDDQFKFPNHYSLRNYIN